MLMQEITQPSVKGRKQKYADDNQFGAIDPATQDETRSESPKAESEGEAPDPSNMSFFTHLYNIPIVNDAVSGVYQIADSNQLTRSIISFAEKPVEKPLAILDHLAIRSLEVVEAKFPIVTKSTPEVIESVQNTAKSAESKFPIVARTFAVANSTLDRVDYVIDYVLPPSGTGSFAAAAAAATAGDEQPTTSANKKNMGKCEDQGGAKAEQEQEERQPPDSPSTGNVDSTIAKVTIIVRKLPRRLGRLFYNQLESSKAIISGVNQTVHDTAHVYGSEISERSYKMLESVQDHIKVVANDTIPSILPQVAQPYYEHSKDMLTTKVVKLHAEYSRTDRSLPTKVLNLMIIGGENLPVIGTVVSHLSRRAEKKYPEPSVSPRTVAVRVVVAAARAAAAMVTRPMIVAKPMMTSSKLMTMSKQMETKTKQMMRQ
ncbi:hypothetical protein BX661DRAFT_225135 [Kickxella alabastrina]|uniref:uncharacterized protein n=1 Tax=Kickxella alabastrina TaxID=61397 RepID=UPI00221E4D58|nr:uncharacterized protein BX661DRAFT_225135 [Kickxella alabastrina]KAI7826432.1 hypothetical protein BX661DRAFT_225135 [Kickxella alabastrina]